MREFVHAHYHLRLTTDGREQVVASVPWEAETTRGQRTYVGEGGPLYQLGLSSQTAWHREMDIAHEPALRVWASPVSCGPTCFKRELPNRKCTLRKCLSMAKRFPNKKNKTALPAPGTLYTWGNAVSLQRNSW